MQLYGDVTLAIDAFSFRTFSGDPLGRFCNYKAAAREMDLILTEDYNDYEFVADDESREINPMSDESISENEIFYTSGFIYMMIPLKSSDPSKIVHIELAPNGSYNSAIDSIAERIKSNLKEIGLNTLFHATDGDKGTNQKHETFFDKYLVSKGKLNLISFEKLISDIYLDVNQNGESIPISDPFHLFKCSRGRLIDYKIQLFPNGKIINRKLIEKVLQLGQPLKDQSQLSRMRDSYVILMYNFENVIKLLEVGMGNAVLLFFAYSCITTSIFCSNITFDFRMSLIETAYVFFVQLYGNFGELHQCGVKERGGQDSDILTFAESNSVKRIINTIIALGIAIYFGPDNLRVDSVGSHLVENSIGNARAISSDPRWSRILATFAYSELKKRLASKLGIQLYISKRVNDGGIKLAPDHEGMISRPSWWNPYDLFEIFKSICIPGFETSHAKELLILMDGLRHISEKTKIKTINSSEVSGSQIIARLLKFKLDSNESF